MRTDGWTDGIPSAIKKRFRCAKNDAMFDGFVIDLMASYDSIQKNSYLETLLLCVVSTTPISL